MNVKIYTVAVAQVRGGPWNGARSLLVSLRGTGRGVGHYFQEKRGFELSCFDMRGTPGWGGGQGIVEMRLSRGQIVGALYAAIRNFVSIFC